jgi:pyruvate,orthophosphate dikinase
MVHIDMDKRQMESNGVTIKEGDWISIDGGSGEAFIEKLDLTAPSLEEQTDLMTLLNWADEICATPGIRTAPEGWPTTGLQVWANSDYPKDCPPCTFLRRQGYWLVPHRAHVL